VANSATEAATTIQQSSVALGVADHIFQSGANMIILWLLAAATVFQIAELVGLLPPQMSNWINRNRLRETMRLLKEFGVDIDTTKRANRVARLENIASDSLAARVTARLDSTKIGHPVEVGSRLSVPGDHYFDLMGATSDLRKAEIYARDLSALWRSIAGVGGPVANGDIDFIVTPKTGSPLLGACLADLLEKPLLLHNPEEKFRSHPDDPRSLFDFSEQPLPGSRGLLVDDSSTGGGKALRLIDDLRACGWQVSDFIVVFEPQLKTGTKDNASARLAPKGVTLHSIIKTT
jgi:orotate phosphoribosyltransferase